jgi:preprotein translocase subunit SecD
VVFFLAVVIAYGLVALGGTWKPALGLDLQGGTRIQLQAKGSPTTESLNEARGIIDQRVNGSGITEAEVTTQGGNLIVVEIPGKTRRDLVDTVKRQAQLRFRTVACTEGPGGATGPCAPATPSGAGTLPGAGGSPSTPGGSSSSTSGSGDGSTKGSGKSSGKSSSKNRPPFLMAGKHSKDAKTSPSASPSTGASASSSPSSSPSSSGSSSSDAPAQAALAFMKNPDPAAVKAFNAYRCPAKGTVNDVPDQPLVTCGTGDDAQTKYLLSPAAIEGTDLKSASAGIPQQSVSWQVNLTLGGEGKQVFADLSRAMAGSPQQFAVVLDGRVISAPTFNGVIPDGSAQISGNFTEASANSLATSLKYGALPIAFDQGATQVVTVGPSLAGDQLSAGITAGIIGLVLVMIYCLLYYRGLGLVVVTSLIVAGIVTYAMVLLLSKGAGFTLSLPGIAGLIVAVGITADSFIVYFERIRDEMRDGRSMRVAVQAGWRRARNTCLAADAVSLLAAVVLYIFAAGVVKGFAFALGLSTIIDLAIFFWFTHPMVTWLARFRFFNRGHKLSGLDAGNLGIDRITVEGRA